MKVLLLTQYFPPETGGPQNRLASLAKGLAEHGHDVTVVTAKPNYPGGVVFEGYEDGWVVTSRHGGIPVFHTWILPDAQKSTFRRILFYLSFMVSSVLTSLRLGGSPDIVVASSPPLLVGLSGWAVSRLEDTHFVFDVRDLWPDVAVAMGELPEGFLSRIAAAVERFIYRRADGITAVTEAFCRDIRDRAGEETPVTRISNGTEPDVFRVEASRENLRRELQLPNGFLVTYAGNIGLAQGLEHLVEAGRLLEQEDADVNLLLVGEGAVRDRLMRVANRQGLENIYFRERVPLQRAARYMAASDALVVPLGNRPIFRKFIPSKLFDAMAAGRPVLLSVDGEAREILEEADGGLYYPPEDASALVDGIRTLKSRHDRTEMGRRARRFVERHFTRAEQARKMVRFLEGTVSR